MFSAQDLQSKYPTSTFCTILDNIKNREINVHQSIINTNGAMTRHKKQNKTLQGYLDSMQIVSRFIAIIRFDMLESNCKYINIYQIAFRQIST